MKFLFLFLSKNILCDLIGQNRLGNNIEIRDLSSEPILTKSFLMVSIMTQLIKNGSGKNALKKFLKNMRKPVKTKSHGRLRRFIGNYRKKIGRQVAYILIHGRK